MAHPVIILCDNDDGLNSVIKNAKSKVGKIISTKTTEPFYHLGLNLYLVKVPEGAPPVEKDIEALFDPTLLKTVLDGKTFNPKKGHEKPNEFGKVVFAEAIVRANAGTIDFTQFADLLTRIEDVLEHYAAYAAPTATPMNTPAAAVAGGVDSP